MNRGYAVFLVVAMTVSLLLGLGPVLGAALLAVAALSDITATLRKA